MTLLYGLVASGQIQLRKIDGHRQVSELRAPAVATAASARSYRGSLAGDTVSARRDKPRRVCQDRLSPDRKARLS